MQTNYSKKPENAALELLQAAYPIVRDSICTTPEEEKWKQQWLFKAKELGADIFN